VNNSSYIEIIIIAVALAMDAFAVSIAGGSAKKLHIGEILKVALFFGLFQAVMPIIGWFGGSLISEKIEVFDHWIAFALLALIGGKMLKEAFDSESDETIDLTQMIPILTLAVATSIDALAVGITFSVLNVSIWSASVIIGLVAFGFSIIGLYLGKGLGHLFGNRVEIFGGVVLIGIGVKVLVEHLFYLEL